MSRKPLNLEFWLDIWLRVGGVDNVYYFHLPSIVIEFHPIPFPSPGLI